MKKEVNEYGERFENRKFADKLKIQMEKKKIKSPEQLAEELNHFYNKPFDKYEKKNNKGNYVIHSQTLRKYLNKVNMPNDMTTYEILANFFNVDPLYLYYDHIENEKFEYQSVGEMTGLSDKAIDNIRKFKEGKLNVALNKMLENESFYNYILHSCFLEEINVVFVEVTELYADVYHKEEEFENPYEAYKNILDKLSNIDVRYEKFYLRLDYYFQFSEERSNFDFEESEETFSYISLKNKLVSLEFNLIQALKLISYERDNEFIEKKEFIPVL